MYHADCKVEFQPFKRLYSQLTFNFLQNNWPISYIEIFWPTIHCISDSQGFSDRGTVRTYPMSLTLHFCSSCVSRGMRLFIELPVIFFSNKLRFGEGREPLTWVLCTVYYIGVTWEEVFRPLPKGVTVEPINYKTTHSGRHEIRRILRRPHDDYQLQILQLSDVCTTMTNVMERRVKYSHTTGHVFDTWKRGSLSFILPIRRRV